MFFNPDLMNPQEEIPEPEVFTGTSAQDDLFISEENEGLEALEQLEEQELNGIQQPEQIEDFYENLAFKTAATRLGNIASDILEGIEEDKASRSEWEDTINTMFKYMGFKVEEYKNEPFIQACSAYDSTLATALIRFFSTARAELFPTKGPVGVEIEGNVDSQINKMAETVKLFLNHYLTKVDEDYYPDSERLLMYVGFCGCAFRKVYQDPITKNPISRLVRPQDFIVNNNTTSLLSSNRITHVLYLSKREVQLLEQSGIYLPSDLSESSDSDESVLNRAINRLDGINTSGVENDSLFKFYESHVYLDDKELKELAKDYPYDFSDSELEDLGLLSDTFEKDLGHKSDIELTKPYIITICEETKKIVSIKRNWKQEDLTYKRIEHFVHYYYLAGFGMYGIGLAHLIGSNSIVLTTLLRQLIDAGTLKNFPGGLRKAGMKIEKNNKAIGPCEFVEIETGGLPIQESVMMMPYNEPSSVLAQLKEGLKQETLQIGGTAETAIPEDNAQAPVRTTLAMLEVVNKVQSSVLRSLHSALNRELKLLFNLFSELLPEQPTSFMIPGDELMISRENFNPQLRIVPVSDPNVLTSTHRLLKAETLLKIASQAPQLHNLREAYFRMYEAMNVDDIEKLLPEPPQPPPAFFDPVSEDNNIALGQPATVEINQTHEAHIFVHNKFLSDLLQNPQLVNPQMLPQIISTIKKHIQLHEAAIVYQQIQQQEIEQQQQLQAQQMQEQMAQQQYSAMPQDMNMQQPEERAQQGNEQQPQQDEPQIIDEKILAMPEVQNALAAKSMQQAQQEIEQQQQLQAQQKPPIDPNEVLLADVQQHREAAEMRTEIEKMKIEFELRKEEMRNELERQKLELQKMISDSKNDLQIELAKVKLQNTGEL